MAKRQIPLAVPGEILLEEFLKPLGVTQYRLASPDISPRFRPELRLLADVEERSLGELHKK